MPTQPPRGRPRYDDLLTPAEWRVAEAVRHGLTNPEIARLGLKLGAISQISRTVRDIQEAQKWYDEVLGLEHLYSFGNLAFFDCGGVRLFLSEAENSGAAESIIYFKVTDVRSAHAELTKRGVEFLGAPHMIHRHTDGTEEWMAAFKDNEGRPLAILSQVRKL
jgi:catechol 2,3-dioxygenase-like lactoylglutathione lyase family enzyme